MSTYEQVADRIAAREASKLRAKAIVEVREDLEAIVKQEVGRVVCQEIGEILETMDEMIRRIEAEPEQNPRRYVIRLLEKMSGKLSVVRTGYAAGSLPKKAK